MRIHNSILKASERRSHERPDVHFHRGPQGQPIPCYETRCAIPQMASRDVHEAADAAKS